MGIPLLARQCECATCSSRTIAPDAGHWVTNDGHIYCLPCAEGQSLQTLSDLAGALA
jgi:hypothetical protein